MINLLYFDVLQVLKDKSVQVTLSLKKMFL